jgi:hypothetical protein
MGYRDDFYIKDNILGYTGNLHGNPTVYFADAGGVNPKLVKVGDRTQVVVSFGHITQVHDIPTNIGREEVGESWSYSISNVQMSDGIHGQECIYGYLKGAKKPEHVDFHTSRNPFESATKGNLEILALAIDKFPKIKKMYEK